MAHEHQPWSPLAADQLIVNNSLSSAHLSSSNLACDGTLDLADLAHHLRQGGFRVFHRLTNASAAQEGKLGVMNLQAQIHSSEKIQWSLTVHLDPDSCWNIVKERAISMVNAFDPTSYPGIPGNR